MLYFCSMAEAPGHTDNAAGAAAHVEGAASDAWGREWSEEERERYLSELGEYDHPLFADKLDVRPRPAAPAPPGQRPVSSAALPGGRRGALTASALPQPESPHVRALQALADEDSTPADKALRLKQQGNALFKQGQRYFQEAEKAYSVRGTSLRAPMPGPAPTQRPCPRRRRPRPTPRIRTRRTRRSGASTRPF